MLNNFPTEKDMQLDPQVASQMLSNIFDACDIEANTVPLEVLTSYSNYRKERFLTQKIILAILLLLFFLLPILFVAPKFTLEQKEGEVPGKPYVALQVTNLIPTDKINAMMGDSKVPVYEMADGTYQVIPDRNGQLEVTVTLMNEQYTTRSIKVTDVDTKSPVLISSERIDGKLMIYFEEDSGILDYENIYAKTTDGEIIKPLSYSEKDLCVTFSYPTEPINIYVSDISDNTLQVVLTLK